MTVEEADRPQRADVAHGKPVDRRIPEGSDSEHVIVTLVGVPHTVARDVQKFDTSVTGGGARGGHKGRDTRAHAGEPVEVEAAAAH